MYIVIPVIVENGIRHTRFNPAHLVWHDMLDQRDADKGTIFKVRTGEEFLSPLPLHELDIKLKEAYDKFASIIFMQIAAEYAEKIKPKRTVRKK